MSTVRFTQGDNPELKLLQIVTYFPSLVVNKL